MRFHHRLHGHVPDWTRFSIPFLEWRRRTAIHSDMKLRKNIFVPLKPYSLPGLPAVSTAGFAQPARTTAAYMENLELTREWDKVFPQSDKVNHSKITFHNRYGITLAADLYIPKNAEGMPEFTKGEIYGGMMAGFASMFGDALTDMPTGKTTEVAFGSTQTWAGIPFEFRRGATSDFPGASILIGGKVYFTHWVPSKSHASHLQISSPAAIDAEIAEAEKSLESGAVLFIGGHGGAVEADAVKFKIGYLKKMKEVLGDSRYVQDFVDGMKKAYPGLPDEAGLEDLGKALCK